VRLDILSGGALAAAVALTVLAGVAFGLELDHVALLGVALGAAVGLVPQGRSAHRLAGFAGGLALAWVGYLLRAAVLPDSASGRVVAALVVVLGCLVVHLVSRHRVPVWSALVGVAALVGAYEETFTAAPPRFLDQSVSAATTVLLAAAAGYLVSAFFAPDPASERTSRETSGPAPFHPVDELTEEPAR